MAEGMAWESGGVIPCHVVSLCSTDRYYIEKKTPRMGDVEKELSARSFSFSPSYSSAGSEASCTVLTEPS
jgi:hypothetical protein